MPEIKIPEGFKGTPEELKAFVNGEVDKYYNKDYKTDTELAEIKALAGVTSDELSPGTVLSPPAATGGDAPGFRSPAGRFRSRRRSCLSLPGGLQGTPGLWPR